jgi:hypothetical protein
MGIFKEQKMVKGTRRKHSANFKGKVALTTLAGDKTLTERSIHRLDRFSLRGKCKVSIQWNLFCIVHNLKKIHRYGARVA